MASPTDLETEALLQACISICDEHKAVDLVVYDMRKTSIVADYYLICTGNSEPHIRALTGSLEKSLRADHDISPRAIEGTAASRWVLMDYRDILVHIR